VDCGESSRARVGTCVDHFRLTSGKTFDLTSKWTATVVKNAGQWKVASYHTSSNIFDNPILNAASQWLMAALAITTAATPMTIPQVSWGMAAVLIGFFVLGFMLYAGLFAAVGATVNSEQEAQQAQMPVVLLLISSMMFAQNVMLQPDGTLARVLSLLPFSAPIVMPLRMTVAPVDTLDIGLALLSVALGAVGTVMIASRIYRTGLLMYGKRPSIREVFRWLRTN